MLDAAALWVGGDVDEPTFEQVTGRPARSYEQWASEHATEITADTNS